MTAVQVMAMSGVGASDRTPFFGARMPPEMKSMLSHLKSLDKGLFRKLLQTAVRALENEGIGEDEFATLASDQTSPEVIRTVYTGILVLLRAALRLPQSSFKSDMFKADLKEIKIPQEFISDLVKAVFGPRRQRLDEAATEHRVRLPTLQSFRWRVNVSISTSALNRVLEPSVLVEMILSSGKIHTFEVPVSKFHELRYNVTYVLKQMEDLERRSILKVQD